MTGTSGTVADTSPVSRVLHELAPALDEAYASTRTIWPAFDGGGLGPIPEEGVGLDAVVAELADLVRGSITLTAPEFSGWIVQGPTTAAVAARAAVGVGGVKYFGHTMNHLEHLALGWLADLCGIPRDAAGGFVSSGSVANLVALGAARQHAWERRGLDVSEDGLPPEPRSRIYASTLAHRTIHRSAAVLGMGRQSVVPIEADDRGRMRVSELRQAIDGDRRAGHLPVAVVAVPGTTDVGSIDPVADIVEVAREHDCWVHVDGAYGLPAYASEALRPLFAGVPDADSWIVDPHKWLATGPGIAAAYVRDGDLLTRSFAMGHAAYFDDLAAGTPEIVSAYDSLAGDWIDQGVEMTAAPRGPMVWAVLREIGRRGVAEQVNAHVALARLLADEVDADPDLELALEPQLSIVCFRHLAPEGVDVNALNSGIVTRLHRAEGLIPSTTVIDGNVMIRPCFINPRQTEAHVYALLDAVRAGGEHLIDHAR